MEQFIPRNLLALADGDNPLDDPIALFIVQLVFILVVSRVLGYLFRFIKQPQVIAEVITGIILGPTVLGSIPGYLDHLFSKPSLAIVTVFANIGLIFFMFLIGIELDPGLLKKNAKSASIIAFASMAAPFGIGALVSILLYDMFADHHVKFSTFLLFCGVAMSITAFPVLARILTETRLTGAKVGLISLSAAAVNDVVAWILLAVVVSIAQAKSPLSTVWTLLIMVAFFLLMAFGVRPVLIRLNNMAQSSAHLRHQMVIVTFVLVLLCSWFTEVIGIHAIFGGFVMGVISPRDHGWTIYITERIEDVIIILLLPLYFTVSGLNTNLRELDDAKSWGICILVIVLACFGKIVGSLAAAKLLGNTWRESITVGILMNTKGLVELIVLNLGRQVGVLTSELFAIFVMMAVITTMLTSPLLHFVWIRNQKKKAAPLIHDSFSVMMCISNQVSGLALVSVAGTLAVQKKKKFSLQALHVTEVTDSPSSYFFAHRRPPPSFLELVKERSRALSLTLKTKQLFSTNVADDIDEYCRTKNFDMILIAWNEPIVEKGGSKIKQVLAHTTSIVGVLVNRGVDEIVQIHKVLALYTGELYQKDALKIVRLMCRKAGVQVTLVSSIPAIELGVDQEPINVIFSEDPMMVAIEESRMKYDLVVVGVAREWSANENTIAQTSELLSASAASVLLVHPRGDKSDKKDLDLDKAGLFWGHGSGMIPMKSRSKSKDFTLDESANNSPAMSDMRKSKSKSKIRVDQSFRLDSDLPYSNSQDPIIARSLGKSASMRMSRSQESMRMQESPRAQESPRVQESPRNAQTPIFPPPPLPPSPYHSPRISQPPNPLTMASAAAIVNVDDPQMSPPKREGGDDLVYVD